MFSLTGTEEACLCFSCGLVTWLTHAILTVNAELTTNSLEMEGDFAYDFLKSIHFLPPLTSVLFASQNALCLL